MSDGHNTTKQTALEPRRPYTSRFHASRTKTDKTVYLENQVVQGVVERLEEQISITASPFLTEEELRSIDAIAPGSAKRFVEATVRRVEISNDNLEKDREARRRLNVHAPWQALGALAMILGVAVYAISEGAPGAGASITIAVSVSVVIALLLYPQPELLASVFSKRVPERPQDTGKQSSTPAKTEDD